MGKGKKLSWNASTDSLEARTAGIIVPVVFSLIFLVGTVGNGLVLAVLLRNGQVKYNTTNLFILNLAVADLCFILFCVPFQATIYTLDGYLAIRYPLKSRDLRTSRNAALAIFMIWTLSLLFAGPYLSYYQIVHYQKVPICVPIWEDQRRKILDILTFVFGYVLPVFVVSLAYARTIKFLWTAVDPIERISESRKAKRRVTKMIIAVAVLFCLCWLPHHLVILCFWFGYFPFNRATYACRLASHCLSYANSCLNPIVYALISKHFRKRFKQVFTCLLVQDKNRRKRSGNKVHVANVTNGLVNHAAGFCGGNTEVTQLHEENIRCYQGLLLREAEGVLPEAWPHQLQDTAISEQRGLMDEEGSGIPGNNPQVDTTPHGEL
ncbi:hypothetical protein JD844_028372 [Phrynosoma platyrhinos]|uniref:G-protein coupled receptors family 1 profile domain-containing protein n=1 Tax=Phrynosoma platyrhinos TaxID=52577 RepID=A0ABQ7SHU7_PHRPL|nr:hypothetical protein JD844_028372 [Phrynosoma platyrhinos]